MTDEAGATYLALIIWVLFKLYCVAWKVSRPLSNIADQIHNILLYCNVVLYNALTTIERLTCILAINSGLSSLFKALSTVKHLLNCARLYAIIIMIAICYEPSRYWNIVIDFCITYLIHQLREGLVLQSIIFLNWDADAIKFTHQDKYLHKKNKRKGL